MAKIGDLSVNIGIEVSEETRIRCCQLLGMYLKDHPEYEVKTSWDKYDSEIVPCVWIDKRRDDENVDNS